MNFGGIVYAWYKKNKRDLPWRHTRNPYLVWVSEVILQQTRVNQGLDYYNKFTASFPDVASLAAASEDQVLKLWQGLGYYSRARNMHQAAKSLVERQAGKMPASYEGLLAMKGVGTYTASAVASICFDERKAVVDGNVARVLARFYGVEEAINSASGKRMIEELAARIMDSSKEIAPGSLNQAMMEFGALQCVPQSPSCEDCPLSASCSARLSDQVDRLPVKIPKRKPIERWMYFYVLISGDETILTRRTGQGIWRSLYHFPMLERSKQHPAEEIVGILAGEVIEELTMVTEEPLSGEPVVLLDVSEPIRHQLTHLTIYARFVQLKIPALPSPLPDKYIKVTLEDLSRYPVPRLMERYMEVAKF